MEIHDVDWKTAIKELANHCRLQQADNPKRFSKAKKSVQKIRFDEGKSHQKKIEYAQKEYNKAVPIKGTLAEKYLREERAISGTLPSDFRFREDGIHLNTKKPTPALIAPYRDKNNTVIGFVRVFLSSEGGKYKETFVDATGKRVSATQKANVGLSTNGSVFIQKGIDSSSIWVAEGIETALSISSALPNQTVVASLSVSQLKNVPMASEVKKVIICADNDPASSNTKKSVIDAVAFHLSKGRKVFIATPSEIPVGMKKVDFNDLLKQDGVFAVQDALRQLVEIKNAEALKTKEPKLSSTLQKIQEEQKANQVNWQQGQLSKQMPQIVSREFER